MPTGESATPLMDARMSRALRRRGTELIGLGLVAAAAALGLALWDYNPQDPGFFSATSSPPANRLGLPGAFVADVFMQLAGWGGWALPVLLGVWGMRFLTHSGARRFVARLALIPVVVLIGAIFAATHAPGREWELDVGLGGHFGDLAVAAIIAGVPPPADRALMVMSLGLGLATAVLSAMAAGMTLGETWRLVRWLSSSLLRVLVLGFKALAALVGISFRIAARIAGAMRPRRSDRLEPAEPTGAWRRRAAAEADAFVDAPGSARALPGATPEYDPAPGRTVDRGKRAGTAAKSRRAKAEAEPMLAFDDSGGEAGWVAPALDLLARPVPVHRVRVSDSALEEDARMLETVLENYGVRGEIIAVKPGPVVTLYELEPEAGIKASRVIGLADDIARSMSALAARVSTVPGRSVIGIELPNPEREKVFLRETLEHPSYGDSRHALALSLGKDIEGAPVVVDLAGMPHLLVAGTTGSGKSVAINTMILSLLYRLSPKQCRMIMIDPKMLELSVYDDIPHLLAPVVTDPKKALVALKWVVGEMEKRYRKMSKMGVRSIGGYNARVRNATAKGEEFSRTVQTGFDETTGEPIYETETFEPEEMSFIVVVVDEMADLMMVAGKEIEACIQRLAQMARASGIHLIMATQRPSVDVVTGTIKANFPTRISFQVTSKIDSRTILGEQGAEQLLGMGDMLYMAGGGKIQRIHGPFVSDDDVENAVRHLKAQGRPDYVNDVTDGPDEETGAMVDEKLGLAAPGDGADELHDRAVAIVARDRKCSTSYIQRKLGIGYNKAARLVERMEEDGVVSPANAVGKREILI